MHFVCHEDCSLFSSSHSCAANLAKAIIFLERNYYTSNLFLVATKTITVNWNVYGK